jgi:hypothetical protein
MVAGCRRVPKYPSSAAAPDFTVTLTGSSSRYQLRGKPVLNFWATWCLSRQLPELQAAAGR